jgi:hypothetical protein
MVLCLGLPVMVTFELVGFVFWVALGCLGLRLSWFVLCFGFVLCFVMVCSDTYNKEKQREDF